MSGPVDWKVHPAAGLFPLLADEELKQLADDIAEHGLHEPVWLWRDGEQVWLLDGRNRVAACEMAGVEPTTRMYEGDSPTEVVLSENVKRRHLSTGQRAGIGHKSLALIEADTARAKVERSRETAARQQRDSSGHFAKSDRVGADPHQHGGKERGPRSSDKAAAAAGTSGRAVAQYKRVVDRAPDLAAKVDLGEEAPGGIALDRAERIIRNREAEQRRVEQAKAEAAAAGMVSTVDIRHGDFRDVLADLTGVDAIITDPAYGREYLPLLADLAKWADQVLAPDGVLAVLMGQTYLPEVYRLLDGGRPYRWTCCYLMTGHQGNFPRASYTSHARKVHSNWKPLIVYGGGPRFADVIRAEGIDADTKNNHRWGQDFGAFHTIVERLTVRGQTVVDPFMGSGTTLLAAHALGPNAVGCDVDEQHVATARARLT
jgi:ParB-like chromosome segregation protein Spo0J